MSDLCNHSGSPSLALSSERLEQYNFCLRPAPRKGLGIFTTEDIPNGRTLIIERPALVWAPIHGDLLKQKQANPEQTWDSIKSDYLQKELDRLPKPKQGEIWSLYNHPENSKECPLLSIFRTNTFGFSEHESTTGVYIFCSRLNHCCDPNCTWKISRTPDSNDPRDRTIRVTAIKDIKAGEELTITYIVRENRVEKRQAELLRAYGFQCACPRCIFELRNLERLYAWPFDGQQKVKLRFDPIRARHTPGDQGWDFLTMIEHIFGEVPVINTDDTITQEAPLILLTKEEAEEVSSSLILEKFQQLSSSSRKAYLRLYNWQFISSISENFREDFWPSHYSESTDEEEFTGVIGSHIRKWSIPQMETLLNIWKTNSLQLDHGIQAVFSFASHLDHSCSPTCKTIWSGGQKVLDLVATTPLKVGDQITRCYNSDKISHLGVHERQWYLKENYGFDCSCFRCYIDLSGINSFAPNTDSLPLSEILTAGEGIDYEPSRKYQDLKQACTPYEVQTLIEDVGGSLQFNWKDQTRQKSIVDEIKKVSHLEKLQSPSQDSTVGKIIRKNENKKPIAVACPHLPN